MLELFERWLRSVGVDLFDLLAASCRQSLVELSPKYLLVAWLKPSAQLAKHSHEDDVPSLPVLDGAVLLFIDPGGHAFHTFLVGPTDL